MLTSNWLESSPILRSVNIVSPLLSNLFKFTKVYLLILQIKIHPNKVTYYNNTQIMSLSDYCLHTFSVVCCIPCRWMCKENTLIQPRKQNVCLMKSEGFAHLRERICKINNSSFKREKSVKSFCNKIIFNYFHQRQFKVCQWRF